MISTVKHIQIKILSFCLALVFFSCFYSSFIDNNLTHKCTHNDECYVCVSIHAICSDTQTPLGSNLNPQPTFNLGVIRSYVQPIYIYLALQETLVSSRVKKSE